MSFSMISSKLPLVWTIGMSEEEKTAFLNILFNNSVLVSRICKILQDRYDSIERQEPNFDNPNWAYREANLIGRKDSIKEILNLFSFV